jgi:hypothetical protein
VLDRVALEALEVRDDMAACMIAPVGEVTAESPRIEELELIGDEVDDELLKAFLVGCGVAPLEAERVRAQSGARLRMDGGALVSVRLGAERPEVQVAARRPETLEDASRRSRRLSSVRA